AVDESWISWSVGRSMKSVSRSLSASMGSMKNELKHKDIKHKRCCRPRALMFYVFMFYARTRIIACRGDDHHADDRSEWRNASLSRSRRAELERVGAAARLPARLAHVECADGGSVEPVAGDRAGFSRFWRVG